MDKAPDKVRPFQDLGFDYNAHRTAGRECYADCLFCGARNKMYVNQDTGQWDCKVCGEKGNTASFIQKWYEFLEGDQGDYNDAWIALAKSRKLPVDVLRDAGLVFDGDLFFIPVRNLQGVLTNLRYYKLQVTPSSKKSRIFGLSGIDAGIYGLEQLADKSRAKEVIYLCEGEWDAIALRWLLTEEDEKGIVLGIPGSNTFKANWPEYFQGRTVILCYDHDAAGAQGLERVYKHIRKTAKKVQYVAWPETHPNEYDIRDYVTNDGSFGDLMELVEDYHTPEEEAQQKEEDAEFIPISSKARPLWKHVIDTYREYFHVTPEFEDTLRIIFAVELTTQIPQDPLWLHVIGPPGTGKTVMLLSTKQVTNTYHISKLSPKQLISGFIMKGGEDPSLVPKLDGKCLVIKDFTTVTSMPAMVKDQVYGVLRDCYDGEAGDDYANGVTRRYKSHFNILTGVTPAIYGERSAALGERFCMFHAFKGTDHNRRGRDILSKVFDNTVNATMEEIPEAITVIVRKFLDVEIDLEKDLPIVPEEYKWGTIALAEIVAALRASVERNVFHRKSEGRQLRWRPQEEFASRLTAQFSKLLLGLGLVRGAGVTIGPDEYRLVAKTALDTCVGFNMEVIASLISKPGQSMKELSDNCKIAISTLDDQIDDLVELGAVFMEKRPPNGPGQPVREYYASERLVELWKEARLDAQGKYIKEVAEENKKGWSDGKRRFKVKMVRRRR